MEMPFFQATEVSLTMFMIWNLHLKDKNIRQEKRRTRKADTFI